MVYPPRFMVRLLVDSEDFLDLKQERPKLTHENTRTIEVQYTGGGTGQCKWKRPLFGITKPLFILCKISERIIISSVSTRAGYDTRHDFYRVYQHLFYMQAYRWQEHIFGFGVGFVTKFRIFIMIQSRRVHPKERKVLIRLCIGVFKNRGVPR